jgi:hypothetical protein
MIKFLKRLWNAKHTEEAYNNQRAQLSKLIQYFYNEYEGKIDINSLEFSVVDTAIKLLMEKKKVIKKIKKEKK